MKEIIKGSIAIIIFMTIVFCVLIIATELLYEPAVKQIRDNYQEELIYPARFSIPSDAMRLNPFYMPNNLKENTEYIPPVYDIIKVNGLGKLISGAEIFFDEEANYYSITYNGKNYTQLATAISNIQDDVFPCSKVDFVNFILVNFPTINDMYVTPPSYSNDILNSYSGIYTSIYDIGLQGSINQNEHTHTFLSEHFENPFIDFEIGIFDNQSDDFYYIYANSELMVMRGDDDLGYQVKEFDFTDINLYSYEDYQADVTPLFEFGGDYSVKFYEGFVWDY